MQYKNCNKLSDQGTQKRAIQKKRIFSVLEKNVIQKRKKFPFFVYAELRYANKKSSFACKKRLLGKCLFEYKFRFAVEKK